MVTASSLWRCLGRGDLLPKGWWCLRWIPPGVNARFCWSQELEFEDSGGSLPVQGILWLLGMWQMSVQLPREQDRVIKTTPGLKLPSTPAVEHGLDPCCKLQSQSTELINGSSSSSELSPGVAQVCGCFSSSRP